MTDCSRKGGRGPRPGIALSRQGRLPDHPFPETVSRDYLIWINEKHGLGIDNSHVHYIALITKNMQYNT